MKIVNPKNGQSFESAFESDSEARAALVAKIAADEFTDAKFPESIASNKKPSAAQVFWLHKLATQDNSKPVTVIKVDLKRLVTMLTTAKANGLKFPSIILTTSDGIEVKLAVAGAKSRYEGALMVASTAFRNGKFFGRVTPEGSFVSGRDYVPEIGVLLTSMSKNPEVFAASQGHLTGRCCFCRKTLDDDKSTELGYGPVCAKKFGLVYSRKAATFSKLPRGSQSELPLKVVLLPKPKAKKLTRRFIDEA